MKILHITRSNSKGPGVFTYTLHHEFLSRGYASRIFTLYKPEIENISISYSREKRNLLNKKFKTLFRVLTRIFNPLKLDWNYFPYSINEQKIKFNVTKELGKIDFNPDIVVLYFIDNFLNARHINEIYQLTKAKIYWFMPDMAAFTGGCHYAWDCNSYMDSCGLCPAIRSENINDISKSNIKYKMRNLEDIPIDLIAASEQLYKQAQQSSLFQNKKISKILVPINPDQYKPLSDSRLKSTLGISDNTKLIFIGSQSISQRRKGFSLLIEALSITRTKYKISKDSIYLIIAGREIASIEDLLPFNYKHLGYLDNEMELPEALAIADFFISPSIEDSGPMMINQSIMAGTPVLAFNIGVASDLILPGETGFIAEKGDTDDLASKINQISALSRIELEVMSKKCREMALSKFSPAIVVKELENQFHAKAP